MGNSLPAGHCEVHPDVAEPYPCTLCLQFDEEQRRYREWYEDERERAYQEWLEELGIDSDGITW